MKEYLGVSVSPASVSLQSVVDGQQKLLSDKEAEIAALKRRVEALEREAAAAATTAAAAADSGSASSRQTTAESTTAAATAAS